MSEVQVPKPKKFIIVDSVKSSAEIYAKTNVNSKDGIRLDTNRRIPLYVRNTFVDKSGKQVNTRYKHGANTIYLDKQIKDDSIPANEKFTEAERNDMLVINGVLVADTPFLLEFIHEDNNPQREEFTGRNRMGATPVIRELNEELESEEENNFIFKTAEALTAIKKMSIDEIGALLAVFFGSSYSQPSTLKERQNIAAKALENNEERINIVLNGIKGGDNEITVLLSKALSLGLISFGTKQDYVQRKKDGEWVDAKLVSADTYEQREILFKQYLASKEGELLRKDIEADIEASSITKKESKKNK